MGVNKVQYGNQVLLDISDATVTPAQLLKGAVAYNAAGEKIAGSLDPMLKSEYGGSGPGIVAMADKASEANSAQSANTAVNAQYAATADTAANASKLGGRTLAQIVPAYTAAETQMPYTWVDGKPVYRKAAVIENASIDFEEKGEDPKTYACNIPGFAQGVEHLCRLEGILHCNGNWHLLLGGKRNGDSDYGGCLYATIADGSLSLTADMGRRLPSAVLSMTLIAEYTKQ